MDCKSVQDVLVLYIKNEMSKNLLRDVDQHLSQCKDCQQELGNLHKIDKIVSGNATVNSSPALQIAPRKYQPWMYYSAAAVLLLLVSLLVFNYFFKNNDQLADMSWTSTQLNELQELNYDLYYITASSAIQTNIYAHDGIRRELDNLNYNLYQISID